jgi:hypothetical protein
MSPPHALTSVQREHSANIKAAPATYPQTDPPKTVNILEFDCRGLEFTEFKAEVGPLCPCATRPTINPSAGRVSCRRSRFRHQVCRHRPRRRRMVRLRREGRRGSEHHGCQVGDPTGLACARPKDAFRFTIHGNKPAQSSGKYIFYVGSHGVATVASSAPIRNSLNIQKSKENWYISTILS